MAVQLRLLPTVTALSVRSLQLGRERALPGTPPLPIFLRHEPLPQLPFQRRGPKMPSPAVLQAQALMLLIENPVSGG